MTKSPSIQEWKELYEVAIEFKKLGCWNWMWDSDLFGVKNPVNGEIGYCCVMGAGGEHFALAVYTGTEGLEGYLKTQKTKNAEDDNSLLFEIFQSQKCLMVSFEDRPVLQKQDIQTIKSLGLDFRGRNSWPFFRNYEPGYHPWYLTTEEAWYLTLALRQAMNVAVRFKGNPKMLESGPKNRYLIRVQKEGGSWEDEWLEPQPFKKAETVRKLLDKDRLEKIKNTARHQGIWEIDFFYAPGGAKEGAERPFYPLISLWVNHNSGMILNMHMAKSNEFMAELEDKFLEFLEKVKTLPLEMLIKKEELFKLLEPAASFLGIKLSVTKRLPALEEAQASMFDFLKDKK